MSDARALAAGAPPARAPSSDGIMLGPWFTPVRIALIIWGLMSLVAIIAKWHGIGALDLSDTDDAMRMAQVRDLLAGQSWWDLSQYRVNPAGGGVLMHWSRIVDAPLAAGILLLKPLFGQAMAERIVMTLWPPLLGAALSVACVLGYRNLSDRRIAYAAPLFLIMSGYILVQFRPLRVDHHGWQIFFAMLIMAQALRPATWQAGVLGGIFAAALLAVSIEGLPIVALFAGLAALRWALGGGAEDRARLCGYMGSLAAGALLLQFATRGPVGLSGTWCDSLSAPYMAAFAAAAAVTFSAARINPARASIRFLLLGVAGASAAVALVWTEPQCANGPFAALDPIVVKYWYRNVLEGQPLWMSRAHDVIHVLVPSVIGLAGSLLAWRSCTCARPLGDRPCGIAACVAELHSRGRPQKLGDDHRRADRCGRAVAVGSAQRIDRASFRLARLRLARRACMGPGADDHIDGATRSGVGRRGADVAAARQHRGRSGARSARPVAES